MNRLSNTPLVLIVLDGFGYSPREHGNAIAAARTPHFDEWFNRFPNQLIQASGRAVGLPAGQMGNSEVGHLNIGAGRVVRMDVSRIDYAVETGDFFQNQVLIDAMDHARQRGSSLHLMGLVSDGGVHSSQEHLYALLQMAKQTGNGSVFVHAFLDGRDTAPDSGARYLGHLLQRMDEYQVGQVASVVGRYYAMDRDRRWDRTEQAYRLLVYGEGRKHRSPVGAIRESYVDGVTDEFVKPVVIVDGHDEPVATVREGDSIVFFNFRADRARQLTRSLSEESFDGFKRERRPEIRLTCMTQYDKTFPLPVAFPPEKHQMILADVLGEAGVRNMRVAETEKYAHVTFFFNGGVEREFPGESRLLVPSPKVATYDLKPEMSAEGITEAVVQAVEGGEFDVLIVNYANADMVGHSGIFDATVKAVEVIDSCLGRVVEAVRKRKGAVVITADHGNAEQMIDPETGGPFTAHTTNPVPIILINGYHGRLREGGRLEDVAPTLLGMLGIPKPDQMTGSDLRIDRS